MTKHTQGKNSFVATIVIIFLCTSLDAQDLRVKVAEPRRTGGKVIVRLDMKNTFTEKVTSARAQIFLFDENGKMVDQAANWVIGGTKDRPALEPDKTTTYSFVFTTDKAVAKADVRFSQIILESGKVRDVQAAYSIQK